MSSKRARDVEEAKRRKLIRQRFRSLIRSVAMNRIWLMDSGEQKLTLNVKKNIAMLVRTQRKIGMLTLAEKTLIRSHHSIRSIEDRKKLVTLLAGLTCFSKIPPKVRARMVPFVKFMYLERGRTIIREGDEPVSIYFILTGEVEVTKQVFDHIKRTYVDKVELISGPGDCIGDIELIEGCKRKNTYTTTTDAELLVLFDEFDSILRPFMSKQWMDKKSALAGLGYFDYLSEEQIVSACKLGVLRQFEPLETIYYEDKGQVSYVHFVISGECMILQCLKLKVKERRGNKSFELIDITKDGADGMFQDLTNTELIKKLRESDIHESKRKFDVDVEIASDEDMQNEHTKRKLALRNMDIKSIEISCGLRKSSSEMLRDQAKAQTISLNNTKTENADKSEEKRISTPFENLEDGSHGIESNITETIGNENNTELHISAEKIEEENNDIDVNESKKSLEINEAPELNSKENIVTFEDSPLEEYTEEYIEEENEEGFEENIEECMEEESMHSELDGSIQDLSELVQEIPTSSKNDRSKKLENHFIDVGSLTFGGIFGLGEKLEHRVIMARTTVQCLMLPRFWLFEKEQNPGNIWQRRRFYLDCTIPSREALFNDFLTTRKWQKYKKELIEQNLDKNSVSNPTKIEDIPIICRIVESTDD